MLWNGGMPSWQKLCPFLQNKVVRKLKLSKNVNTKIFSLNPISVRKNFFWKIKSFFDTLQMFCMLFLQSYVCQPNSQTTLSNFNSLKPVIQKKQFNAVFTVFQKGFLHVFVCNFWIKFSIIFAAYMKQILKEIVLFFTDECM